MYIIIPRRQVAKGVGCRRAGKLFLSLQGVTDFARPGLTIESGFNRYGAGSLGMEVQVEGYRATGG